ncbi:hypothetical protein [Sphingopyxis sp.]|uniref:hypothetical protein n=1 Tax=Sphingopyxis sp. TaxID=1908224 RepID=UPI0035AFED08
MRVLLIVSALAAVFAATSAAAEQPLIPVEPEPASEPSALVPLAPDSPWTARFAAAADELLPALRSLDESRWAPLLGGQWLAAPDRARVAALLADRDGPFRHALFAEGFAHRVILGWQPPATLTAEDRAAISARSEAEAIICWASGGTGHSWPRTAAEADNAPGRPYACARIAYSIRGETPNWRAFIERG